MRPTHTLNIDYKGRFNSGFMKESDEDFKINNRDSRVPS